MINSFMSKSMTLLPISIYDLSYKSQFSFERRLASAERIINKYPERIPVIVERSKQDNITPRINKRKYLVPMSLTVGQFLYVIRKRIKLPPEKALFIFINNIIPPTSELLGVIYDNHKDKDKFLYMEYSGENVFGGFM